MVKKISFWTAAGQFLAMVERQRRQDSLRSASNLRSVPLPLVAGPVEVRKTTSCPMVVFSESAQPAPLSNTHLDSDEQLDANRTECSLFEKMDDYFSTSPVRTSQPSLFVKMDELFDEIPEPAKMFDCPACLSWKSLDNPSVPQLPVFVKSPVDSLVIYGKNKSTLSGEIADDELSTVSSPSISPSSDDTFLDVPSIFSDMTTIPSEIIADYCREARFQQQIELQKEVIQKQAAIISSLAELLALLEKLNTCS